MGELHQLVHQVGRDRAREMVEPSDRNLVDIAARILAEGSAEIELTYSGFALISLPHKDPKAPLWERRNGRCSLLLQAGRVYERGNWVDVGLPYGSRARLLLLYIQTEALRTNSRTIVLGRSLYDWMEKMGIKVGGTSYAAIREQARRISGSRLSFGWQTETGEEGFSHAGIIQGAMFVAQDANSNQRSLFEERCEISEPFFHALQKHPVPIWAPAVREIANRSTAIDIYVWLAYRLHALRRPTLVPWPSLFEQFGSSYDLLRKFRQRFITCLKESLAVYPEAKVEITKDGVLLHPSRPPVPERTYVQVVLPGRLAG